MCRRGKVRDETAVLAVSTALTSWDCWLASCLSMLHQFQATMAITPEALQSKGCVGDVDAAAAWLKTHEVCCFADLAFVLDLEKMHGEA